MNHYKIENNVVVAGNGKRLIGLEDEEIDYTIWCENELHKLFISVNDGASDKQLVNQLRELSIEWENDWVKD